MTTLVLTFRIRGNWPFISLLLLLCVLVFQSMSLRQHRSQNDFTCLINGDVGRYARGLLYYIPVEFISVGIILVVLMIYRKWLRLDSMQPTVSNLIRYELAFLPAVLVSIVIICPVTNAVRYAFLYANHYSWHSYYPDFFFTWSMYFKYLLSVSLFSYVFLNANLILDYIDWHQNNQPNYGDAETNYLLINAKAAEEASGNVEENSLRKRVAYIQKKVTANWSSNQLDKSFLQVVEVYSRQGNTFLSVDTVIYFEVHGKSYQAHTVSEEYRIRKTILELEKELDPKTFFRLSRSVIVNIRFVANYSHWEYDKFIVRIIGNPREFIMQRKRLKALKLCLSNRSCIERAN